MVQVNPFVRRADADIGPSAPASILLQKKADTTTPTIQTDIAVGCGDSLFRKMSPSGMAENRQFKVHWLIDCSASIASIGERQLSGNENFMGWKILTT